MSFRDYIRAIRRSWWIVGLAIILTGAAAAFVTYVTPKQYATTVVFFVKTPSDQISTAAQGDTFGQKRVNSYVQLAGTDRLLAPVIAKSGINVSTEDLAKEITASGDLNTVLLKVVVTDPSPTRSIAISKALSTVFVKVVADLESSGETTGDPTVRLELVSGPTFDGSPVEPKPALNYGVALLLGVALGVGIAVLREVLNTTVRSVASLEKLSGGAVLGIVPFDDTAKKHPLILDGDAGSVRAEAFRQLRTNLEFLDVDNPARIIVVTSSVPEEGKSSTVTNLAVIFAEAGKNVVLIEGDLRRPRVAEYLGLEGAVGLTNVLAGQASLSEVLQPWGRGGLTVLPSGSIPPNPSELLGSKSMTELLRSLAAEFDVVLIDSPPLLPVTDGAILAAHSDGAMLIIRHGYTTRQQLAMALAALKRVDARYFGSILNMAPTKGADAYMYGYGYGYGPASYRSQILDVPDEQHAVSTRTPTHGGTHQYRSSDAASPTAVTGSQNEATFIG